MYMYYVANVHYITYIHNVMIIHVYTHKCMIVEEKCNVPFSLLTLASPMHCEYPCLPLLYSYTQTCKLLGLICVMTHN